MEDNRAVATCTATRTAVICLPIFVFYAEDCLVDNGLWLIAPIGVALHTGARIMTGAPIETAAYGR
jgi:hypothetical protein